MATQVSQMVRVGPLLADHRRATRPPVAMTRAGPRTPGDAPCDMALIDLSTFGCRLAGEHDAAVGERVRLSLAGTAADATVMWCRDEMIGCRFDQPIARPLMRSLVLGLA